MTLYELSFRLDTFLMFWANIVVCVAAVVFYQQRPMRPVLFIAIACGLGALLTALPWIAEEPTASSRGFLYLTRIMSIADSLMWAIGSCWFFRELVRKEHQPAA